MLRGLRARLVVAFLLVAIGSGLGAAVISFGVSRTALLQTTQDELMETFLTRATDVANTVPGYDETSLSDFAVAIGGAHVVLYRSTPTLEREHVVAWPQDMAVPRELEAAVQQNARVYFQRVIQDDLPYLYVGTGVIVDGQRTGVEVYQRFSLEDEQESLAELQRGSMMTLAGSAAVALVLALVAARSVLRPVRDLNRGARRLGEGALDTRLPVRGKDELADLVGNFNAAAAELERTVAQLRHEEQNSRRFVADVSHELRTPLAAMVATAETLESEAGQLTGDGAGAARTLIGETNRMAELVENLIEISRFDARHATLVAEEVDLGEVVRATLAARGWTNEVLVQTDSGNDVRLSCDPRRIDVVVANLVGNALEHGRAPVSVTVYENSSEVSVRVHDSGPALDPAIATNVFERFYKAGRARRRSHGSGLGLAIALENARLHGGRIELVSERGSGTTFTLRIPRRHAGSRAAEEEM